MATAAEIIAAAQPKDLTEALLSSINTLAATSGDKVQGLAADGAAVSGNPVLIAGQDGTNAQSIVTDTTGRLLVSGAAAAGAAKTGNPVLMGGQDGTNAQTLLVDSSGRAVTVGAAAAGAAKAGNPVLVAGQDGTNAQSMLVDSSGRVMVVGGQADSGAVAGNPVLVALNNAGSAQTLRASNGDGLVGGLLLAEVGYLWNGTNFDRPRVAALADTGLSVGIPAGHQTFVDSNNGTFTSVNGLGEFRARVVSATNTANVVTIDMRNLSTTLAIHAVCSAGTAGLTVEVSADNSNFLTIDSIAAAATQIKQYTTTTVGAGIALSPLSFRYVRVTMATAGVGNTTTLTIGAK